jgi:2-polyprenyl-3-methyl-5-hydroxy-6-metoxy-1,4-benzoquinol methylase
MTLRWKIAQWFELQWWQNYLRGKDKTAYLTWKKDYWRNMLWRVGVELKTDFSKSVIDMGCGPAGIFLFLDQKNVTAVDPLLNEYEKRTNFFKRSDYPNVNFVQSTIEDFDPAGLKYDKVFCMNAINHVHNIEKGFDQLKNLCVGNGYIIVTIDAHNFSFFKHLFRLIPGDILHPHQYDLREYQQFLSSGNWKIKSSALLKKEFFFNHYLLIARKKIKQ